MLTCLLLYTWQKVIPINVLLQLGDIWQVMEDLFNTGRQVLSPLNMVNQKSLLKQLLAISLQRFTKSLFH